MEPLLCSPTAQILLSLIEIPFNYVSVIQNILPSSQVSIGPKNNAQTCKNLSRNSRFEKEIRVVWNKKFVVFTKYTSNETERKKHRLCDVSFIGIVSAPNKKLNKPILFYSVWVYIFMRSDFVYRLYIVSYSQSIMVCYGSRFFTLFRSYFLVVVIYFYSFCAALMFLFNSYSVAYLMAYLVSLTNG